MVHMKKGKVEVQFDDVVDILPGKEDVRIWVRVVHLWKVPAFLNPSESSSLEMVLVVEKVSNLCVCLVFWLFVIDIPLFTLDLGEIQVRTKRTHQMKITT
jgi:hypothetical protein